MSHEIRTPLNIILGFTQILRRDARTAPDQHGILRTVEDAGNHLLTLINEILDLSKIEAGAMELHPKDCALAELLKSLSVMFDLKCSQKKIDWRTHYPGLEQVAVHADEGKLRQVLINLLGNAVKFTEQGTVSLHAYRLDDDLYGFEVRDSGPGLSPEAAAQIFKPFYQTAEGAKKGGTGLGLSIAHKQLALMGSRLQLESTPGHGCRFFFEIELPPALGAPPAHAPELSRVARLVSGQRVRALVVDDVEGNREVLSHMLSNAGVEAACAGNGQQALDALAARPFDIVFLDLRMPVMDGFTALRRIVETYGEAAPACVAISASTLHQELETYAPHGFQDFVAKPFKFEEIYDCISRLLGVRFAYQDLGAEEAPLLAAAAPLPIPEPLLLSLLSNAEQYCVSDLEGDVKALAALGEAHAALAARLEKFIGRYDMEGFAKALRVAVVAKTGNLS